jgi:(2Fe-2S) ferredoxin
MRELSVPPTCAHVLVCVDGRCAVRGSQELHRALWQAMDDERLAYYRTGGSVRMTSSGCLGACDDGPTVAIYASDTTGGIPPKWYGSMTLAETLDVVRTLNSAQDQGGY